MNKWLKKLENIMTAVSFAEAGEFETAVETVKEQRKILLALSGAQSDASAFKYAMNSCVRMEAALEILYVAQLSRDVIKKYRSELKRKGVDYRLIKKSGSLEEAVKNHAGMKRDILFVVVEVSEDVNIHSKKTDKIIANAWDNLKCPLVVVSRDSNLNQQDTGPGENPRSGA